MKLDQNEFPNLRDAFPPVPEGFAERIRETLEKVIQEPPPVRRTILAFHPFFLLSDYIYQGSFPWTSVRRRRAADGNNIPIIHHFSHL